MESSKEKQPCCSPIAKWSVIGIITITALIVLHGPLAMLIDRITLFKWSGDGIEFTSAITPIGNTSLSNIYHSSSKEDGYYRTYVSDDFNYKVSWPDNGHWNPDDSLGFILHDQMGLSSKTHLSLFLMYKTPIDSFTPNINILTESIRDTMDITKYVNLSIEQLKTIGYTFEDKETDLFIDTQTQTCVATFYDTKTRKSYLVQKYILASGKAYVLTITSKSINSKLTYQINKEMQNIMNSFHLIQ